MFYVHFPMLRSTGRTLVGLLAGACLLLVPAHGEEAATGFRRGIAIAHALAWAAVGPPLSWAFVFPPFGNSLR
jgi:hypothetical protein